ncbi:hypothetical protein ACN20G_28005 (plasmid) [Streptomyces sp. BI20]|uniref:hypothetical protein n=1 Tax=Streptomyces sp. BI20 TaxID=3403460 RepID=UPI003C7349F5
MTAQTPARGAHRAARGPWDLWCPYCPLAAQGGRPGLAEHIDLVHPDRPRPHPTPAPVRPGPTGEHGHGLTLVAVRPPAPVLRIPRQRRIATPPPSAPDQLALFDEEHDRP